MDVVAELLQKNYWRLKDCSGNILQSQLCFRPDGNIIGSSHANESHWVVQDNKLLILSDKKICTSIFDELFLLGGGFYQALGVFYDDYIDSLCHSNYKTNVILESVSYHKREILVSELGIESKLGKKTNKLIIQINSVASPFDGNNHKREFNYLSTIAGLDLVRVSQSKPLYWYINMLDELESVLSGYIASGYDHVFILGSSAGGYASLVLGEMLSSRFTRVNFVTHVINPQTTLEEDDINVLKNYDEFFIHQDIINHDRLLEKQSETRVAGFLSIRRDNVIHHVSYDCLNPVEVYYCDLIRFSPRVFLHKYSLGISHGDGCIQIGDSLRFRSLFLSNINEKIAFVS